MVNKFKIGDKIRGLKNNYNVTKEGWEGYVNLVYSNGFMEVSEVNYPECLHSELPYYIVNPYFFELINKESKLNHMSLTEKFVLALTSEPKKSFRKANITNGDDILTDEGTKVFLTWLLHTKHAEEFKKDVVDGLIEDMKEEKKSC